MLAELAIVLKLILLEDVSICFAKNFRSFFLGLRGPEVSAMITIN